jgi:hypothetical protein
MINILFWICLAFAALWLISAFFYEDADTKEHCITRSAVYAAASFIIQALNHVNQSN